MMIVFGYRFWASSRLLHQFFLVLASFHLLIRIIIIIIRMLPHYLDIYRDIFNDFTVPSLNKEITTTKTTQRGIFWPKCLIFCLSREIREKMILPGFRNTLAAFFNAFSSFSTIT